jgi:hypothetical protein
MLVEIRGLHHRPNRARDGKDPGEEIIISAHIAHGFSREGLHQV